MNLSRTCKQCSLLGSTLVLAVCGAHEPAPAPLPIRASPTAHETHGNTMNIDKLEIESPLVESRLTYALKVPDAGFVPREKVATLLTEPFVQSEAMSSFFLRPDFNPHRLGEGVRWSVHATSGQGTDLLRARYETQDLELSILEGRTFVLMQARPSDIDKAFAHGRRAHVVALLTRLVQSSMWSHTWTFRLPDAVDDLSRTFVVSNDGAPAISDLHDHNDRADILIEGYGTGFLFYKRIGQREGFEPVDAWFGQAARSVLLQQQSP